MQQQQQPKKSVRGSIREINQKTKNDYVQLAQAITHIMIANRAMLHILLDHGLVTMQEFNTYMGEAEALTAQNQRIGIRINEPKSGWQRIKRFFFGAFRKQPHKKVTPEQPQRVQEPQPAPTPVEAPQGEASN